MDPDKTLISLAIILALVSFATISLATALDFQGWCQLHGKVYKTAEEQRRREQVFYDNVKIVNQLNEKHKGKDVTFAVNKFADMTSEEFKSTILMPDIPIIPLAEKRVNFKSKLINVPDSFDWRTKNVVTDVKNQGTAGTCWAFSTIGNVEGQWAKAGNELTSLSVQQVVDCDDTYIYALADCGVDGGIPFLAYGYIMQAGGIESEASYPYCSGKNDSCAPCAPSSWNYTMCSEFIPKQCKLHDSCPYKLDRSKFVAGLKLKERIWLNEDEESIVAALLEHGPLSACLDAATEEFMNYKSGVINPSDCTDMILDHAILIVGYGEDNGQPYWLIKNSWGTDWGMDGYVKLFRGNNTCGISKFVTTAILK